MGTAPSSRSRQCRPAFQAVIQGSGRTCAIRYFLPLGQHPFMQSLGNRSGLCRPHDLALFRCQILGFPLHLVQQLDVLQSLLGQHALIGDVQIEELAPGVGHAANLGDAVAEPGLVAGIIVTHQLALPVTQEGAGMLIRSTWGERVYHRFDVCKGCCAVGSDVGIVGFLLAGSQHADRCFIGVQDAVFQ